MSSEELKREMESEENDFRYMALRKKYFREKRLEKFEDMVELIEEKGYNVTKSDEGKFTIKDTPMGIVDYFPKSDTLLIRKENKWIKRKGLVWIKETLLKE